MVGRTLCRVERPCVICRVRPSTRRSEHVEPQWEHRLRNKLGQDPTRWTRSGEVIVDDLGRPVVLNHRMRSFVDMCEPCNTELNRRFEGPARSASSANPQQGPVRRGGSGH